MSRLPVFALPEMDRLRSSAFGRVVLVVLTLIPSIYAGLLIWSNVDVTNNLNHVPAAVVNQDQPVKVKGTDGKEQTIALGRSIASSLTTSQASNNFDWQLTSADDANDGLRTGKYYAVLTLPQAMSKDATSTANPDTATAATMDLQTNDTISYLSGTIASSISTAVVRNTSDTLTSAYLNKVYLGFNGIHANLTDAASGAGQLEDGAAQLQTGATKLSSGAGQLKSGLDTASTGANQLASGADRLSAGASSLAGGAGQLQSGADALASGAGRLNAQTQNLPGQTKQLATGAQQLTSGATALGGAATQLGTAVGQFGAAGTQLQQGAKQVATGADAVSDSVGSYTRGVDALAAQCAASGADASFCAQLSKVSGTSPALRAGANQVSTGATTVSSGAAALGSRAGQITTAGTQFGTKARQFSAGASQLQQGLNQLASGTPKLTAGVQQLATGANRLSAGADQLATGATSLSAGATTLSTKTNQLSSGLGKLDAGAAQLQTGANSLASGAKQVHTGATKLHDGLTKGVDQVPSYSDAQRKQLEDAVSQPVTSNNTRDNAVPSYGHGLAPYFGALGLWVGAMGLFFMLKPLSQRAIASTTPSYRVALNGYLLPALLGLVQSLLMFAVLKWGVGLDIARVPTFLGIGAVFALTCVAINHMLNAVLGAPGRFIGLILTVLQLSAAGATYPIQTSPPFFQALHPYLPVTYGVEGLRAAIAGGSFNFHPVIWVLLAWLVGSLMLTAWAAKRQRGWTISRLRPAVAL